MEMAVRGIVTWPSSTDSTARTMPRALVPRVRNPLAPARRTASSSSGDADVPRITTWTPGTPSVMRLTKKIPPPLTSVERRQTAGRRRPTDSIVPAASPASPTTVRPASSSTLRRPARNAICGSAKKTVRAFIDDQPPSRSRSRGPQGSNVPGSCSNPVGRESDERLRVDGPADVEALGEVAAELTQELERGLVFDAFRHNLEAQIVRELDRRPDDDALSARARHGADERLVDLQPRDRQLGQVAQGGVPGAEVVDRELEA